MKGVDNVGRELAGLLGTKCWSSWWLMASLRAQYRDQYCFNVFINDLEDGVEGTVSKFVADTKPQGAVNILDGFHSKRPGQAGEMADIKPMKFKKSMYKDLHVGWNNSIYHYRLGV